MEIRLHGRGGQGGVTCAKILAAAHARLGKFVQTFGDYASERSGAPVRAYTRVSDRPITNRNKVYRPDHLVVLDSHLLGVETLDGLVPGGSLLVNTKEAPETFDERFDAFRLGTVDATAIARRLGIGTRSVVIVNTTIAGAFARLHNIPLYVLEETYRSLGFLSNFEAAHEAFEAVRTREPRQVPAMAGEGAAEEPPSGSTPEPEPEPIPVRAPVEPLQEHTVSLPTDLKTGSWSSQRPHYVENPAPCNAWCPAGNDVVGFVQALARSGEAPAAEILRQTTPLSGTCGRVCPAPCMEGCNRVEYDGAVNIRGLERWISDRVATPDPVPATEAPGRSVAIVGGGPAGLSAAYTLARAGHGPTIFEGERELGGILTTGIPSYRLPRDVVQREVADILALGVETRLGEFLTHERLREIAVEYDATILATGLQRLRWLDVPGSLLAGIEQGIHFLHRVNLGTPPELDGHVVVLGGGNTAIDCARSALRLGARCVTIAYRRSRGEMPAIDEEIDEALNEGIELRLLRQPVGFVGKRRLEGVELAEVELGEPDDTGRRRPVVTDRVQRVACDHVLLALGQSADLRFLPAGWELDGERIRDGEQELPVFAAGDLATGDGTVAHAIGSGRRAAEVALRALGLDVEPFERPDRGQAVPATDIRFDHFERRAPARDQHEPDAFRVQNFTEANLGLPHRMEAHRCFSCGHCTLCDTCLVYCPEGIVRREKQGYELDYSYCKGCGICVHECPRSGMEMTTP